MARDCTNEEKKGGLTLGRNLSKITIIFLSINLNMCFGCSKELSH